LRGQSLKDLVTELLRREIDTPAGATRGTRKKGAEKFGRELDALAREINKKWKPSRDAAGAVREQRRD
jgi:hypothetical protein